MVEWFTFQKFKKMSRNFHHLSPFCKIQLHFLVKWKAPPVSNPSWSWVIHSFSCQLELRCCCKVPFYMCKVSVPISFLTVLLLLSCRWELTGMETVLLSFLVRSLPPCTSCDIPVYLPYGSPKVQCMCLSCSLNCCVSFRNIKVFC